MAAHGIASLRRILYSAARAPAVGNGCREWWALMQQGSLCSSVENVAGLEETWGHVGAKASRQRWKELPAVPLESAVRALEEIESKQSLL